MQDVHSNQFRLWGRVEAMGPALFRVVVAAVPAGHGKGPLAHDIRRAYATNRITADLLLQALSQRLRDVVAARGDSIREYA